jgi:rhodanese-related sulfurtransferase
VNSAPGLGFERADRTGPAAAGASLIEEKAAMDDLVEGIFAAAHGRALEDHLPYFGAVTPSDAYSVIKAAPNARLIDVRTRPEWDYVGHVPESSLLEWNVYPDGRRNPEFLAQLQIKAPDLEAPVFFLCRSGHRSDGAARMAAAAGYSKAFNVLEGFEGDKDSHGQRGKLGGWRKAGLPWVQG